MNGVETKRHPVTQEDCNIARFFTKRGMKIKDIAKMLNVDASTISKIKSADFRLDQYLELRKESNRKTAENKAKKKIELLPAVLSMPGEQLAGQMQMDLKPETPEMSDQTKMMRFQAHQTDRIIKKLDEILTELRSMRDGGANG